MDGKLRRILQDQKMIFGSSNNMAKDAIENLVSDLLRKVKYHTADEFNVIPEQSTDVFSKDWSANSPLQVLTY